MRKLISFLSLLLIFFGIGYAFVWAITEGDAVKIIATSIISGIALWALKEVWWELWD